MSQINAPSTHGTVQTHHIQSVRRAIGQQVHLLITAFPDGFTFDSRRLCLVAFEANEYVVSLYGHERRHDELPTVRQIESWLTTVATRFSEPGVYVGYWRDQRRDEHVLDLSIVVVGLSAALARAEREQQDYIYDAIAGTCIPVKLPRRTAA